MSYNMRRNVGGEVVNSVGSRRNQPQPVGNNFVPAGQLTPNRPQLLSQGPRPQGFNNQANGNFTPQPQKVVVQAAKLQQQRPVQAVPLQQQQQAVVPMQVEVEADESTLGEESEKKKPFWVKNTGKITRKERQRRRNVRLSKILQPKNAVMILNELVKSATYSVTDIPQPGAINQYTATVNVEGMNHNGHGRTKVEAKNQAAEAALKFIVKNRQFSATKSEEKMEVSNEEGDGSPPLPWQHVASFALYKLLNSWGEDPNQPRGLGVQTPDSATAPLQNKPAKKLPENAVQMNPLMLLNQMLPQVQFEELERSGNAPNVTFTFRCNVNGQNYMGSGPNKKAAKKLAAFAVCSSVLGLQYSPDLYTPVN